MIEHLLKIKYLGDQYLHNFTYLHNISKRVFLFTERYKSLKIKIVSNLTQFIAIYKIQE